MYPYVSNYDPSQLILQELTCACMYPYVSNYDPSQLVFMLFVHIKMDREGRQKRKRERKELQK